jgi:hypothetical protein
MDEKYYIVRTRSAGVFHAQIKDRNGKEGTLSDSIRIHYWDGAASLSQLAMEGTKKPDNCRFAMSVSEMIVTEIIELIPCTLAATVSIKEVPVWKI